MHAPVGVVDEPFAARRPPRMKRLLERIENKAGMRPPADPPADDPPGKGVNDEGDIDEAGPGRDIGEVRDPQPVRRRGVELPLDPVERARRGTVAHRGADQLPRIAP